MNVIKKISLLLFICLVGFYFLINQRSQTVKTVNLPKDHILFQINESNSEIKKVKLNQWDQKYRLFNFWASWCGVCEKERPTVINAWKELSKEKIQFFGIATSDNLEDLYASEKVKDNIYPLFFDKNDQLQSKFQISTLPQTFVLNEKNELVFIRKGPLKEKHIEILKIIINK